MNTLRDRVIVVTGAAGGIGRALTQEAKNLGMRIVVGDLDGDAAKALAAEVSDDENRALGLGVDVSDPASMAAFADEAFARFGHVHVLVNNAGIAAADAAWEMPLEVWQRVLGVNLNGVVHGVLSFLPRMIAGDEEGHIVNVASAAGLVSAPCLGAYAASKFGVVGLSESLFHDLALRKTKIGVSVLCPSWVKTSIAAKAPAGDAEPHPITAGVRAAVGEAVRKGIAPEDVAQEVFYAVRTKRFYIVTHEETKAGLRRRTEDILEGRAPTLFPIQTRREGKPKEG